MDIADHGAATPDKVALVMGSGARRTYGDLTRRSNRVAQLLYGAGLRRGDGVLLMLPNRPEVFEVTWAAQRSGLYYTPVNTHLTSDAVAYIVRDSGAKALVVDAEFGSLAQKLQYVDRQLLRLSVGGGSAGYDDYDEALAGAREDPPPEPSQGTEMMYSSGTTGYPKAVRRPLP